MNGRKVSLEEIERGLKDVREAMTGMGDSLTLAREAFLGFSATRANPSGLALVHACPPDGSGLMPCCGRTPLEVSVRDRMSVDGIDVTCEGLR